ncbi:LANO_0E13608g1_1 [Lachancea nothofagi CBS 11611]|uniref:LANO_0E13608g1_1 n=1 Tax=Lachancea nothofagi CBS 11611 TaxID=1266666 RepID=A0A1G4JZ49_9SACH|nr:LANO_0E13608g1_1 [Lachancea nothofagi CBS 11611]
MEHSGDSFEYLLHLTKVLSTECRTTRQGTERIEHSVKRLAKISQVSYEELSKTPEPEVWQKYRVLSAENEKDRLIRENYAIIYQIERQEYVCRRIWALIDQIEDLLESIKQFVVEQRAHRVRTESQFVESVVQSRIAVVQANSQDLTTSQLSSQTKLNMLVRELREVCDQVDWAQLPASRDAHSLHSKLLKAQEKYKLDLIKN